MGSIPPVSRRLERMQQIEGAMPRLSSIPRGCAYNPRCPQVFDRCRQDRPELMPAGETSAACWLYDVESEQGVLKAAQDA
jgi:peptide/nickel transport system ATP-binding protein